jgi:hypothetical protein
MSLMSDAPPPWRLDWFGARKTGQFLAILGYLWVLAYTDRVILAPAFGYQGLSYQTPAASAWLEIVTLVIACTALTPVRLRQPSDGVLYFLLPLVVVPVLLVAVTDPVFALTAQDMTLSMAGAFILLALCSRLPRPPRTANLGSPSRPWMIAALLSAATYALTLSTFGLHFQLLPFSNVYSTRAVFADQAPGLLGYLVDWQTGVVNTALIIWGCRSRRRWPIVAAIAGDLLIYSVTGFKSVLFALLATAAFLAALRHKGSREPAVGMRLAFMFVGITAAATAADAWRHSITWTSLLVRRLSLVAGVNTGYYFQYFNSAPHAHLAYGVTGALLGNSRTAPPPQQIAMAYYHSAGSPNANMWADGYANFGHAGVIAFTLVLAGFLWLYDSVSRHTQMQEAAVLLAIPALSLVNSALLTCLVTHGLLLALAAVMPWSRRASAPVALVKRQLTTSSSGLARLRWRP